MTVASPDGVVNDVLLADTPVTDLTSTRIWGGTLYPPAGADYTPADGEAICHKVVGGLDDYSDLLQHAMVQLKCYAQTEAAAELLARTVHDVLQGYISNKVKWSRRTVLPQVLTEPDTGWVFSFVTYHIMIIN